MRTNRMSVVMAKLINVSSTRDIKYTFVALSIQKSYFILKKTIIEDNLMHFFKYNLKSI